MPYRWEISGPALLPNVPRSSCSPPHRQFARAGNGPMTPTVLRVASSGTIDSMTEDEREAFIDTLVHEDRQCAG